MALASTVRSLVKSLATLTCSAPVPVSFGMKFNTPHSLSSFGATPMRYNPATDRARDIESLVAQSREAIKNCTQPASIGYVWSPEQLTYVPTTK